jgi:hypothetical protein
MNVPGKPLRLVIGLAGVKVPGWARHFRGVANTGDSAALVEAKDIGAHIRDLLWREDQVGIFGCEVVRKTCRAVAVIPLVFAIFWKSGPITMIRGDGFVGSTTWQELKALRARVRPAAASLS